VFIGVGGAGAVVVVVVVVMAPATSLVRFVDVVVIKVVRSSKQASSNQQLLRVSHQRQQTAPPAGRPRTPLVLQLIITG
jgi:hypothetical protein